MAIFAKIFLMDVQIHPTWKQVLKNEFSQPYFAEIVAFLKTEKAAGKTIYPKGNHIFNAFNFTPFNEVKVVILGQDPYHGPNQAHGLSFSVLDGIKPPPSLVNIFKELRADVGITPPPNFGNLTHWATQGVLLLNATLTVRDGEPNSHAKIGWTQFTNAVIETLSNQKEHIVFILWGKFAQEKASLIDEGKHYILQTAHPSPFSADKGFYGSKPFSTTNQLLIKNGCNPIDWSIQPTNI